jgi:uncharacterized protein (DUF302 family)
MALVCQLPSIAGFLAAGPCIPANQVRRPDSSHAHGLHPVLKPPQISRVDRSSSEAAFGMTIAMPHSGREPAMQTTIETFEVPSQARAMHLPDVPVSESRARLRQALAREGFSLIADVDLADLLNRMLDERIEPYFIIEACHPGLAQDALGVAWDGGLLMPTRFCVWKEGSGSTIATLAPYRLAAALGRRHFMDVAAQIDERLDGVFEQLQNAATGETIAPAVAGELELDEAERRALNDATRHHIEELLKEAAKTESRPLQHELAQTIDRLERIARKLGVTPGAPQ